MATAESQRFLLDTHTFLWLATDPERVRPEVRSRLADASAEVWLSVASIWEMAIKTSLGKLSLRTPLGELVTAQCEAMSLSLLEVGRAHALGVESLPFHHRDPFDRLLVAQAVSEQLILVSADASLDAYPINRLW